jgi:hypothetical protein
MTRLRRDRLNFKICLRVTGVSHCYFAHATAGSSLLVLIDIDAMLEAFLVFFGAVS